MTIRAARARLKASARLPAHEAHRIVVLASEPVRDGALVEEIARHARHPEDDVVMVAPTLGDSALKLGASERDSARARAKQRLLTSVEALRRPGLHATGEVGDADPNVALADAMRSSPADEVIVATIVGYFFPTAAY